ncbi:phenoloxidase 2-like isoform X2 [Orussus abietinus]|uniref:phenoloxidase 2-like isoform X2 n=1 Tax=Orussus abietinus TaxID=222816 RepID=UPI000626AC46|nr:phenoloxidase 2-like isoform X2 [Orussus abietinus]
MSRGVTDLLYLFDRPSEPVFVPRGENNVSFDIPGSYADRYRSNAVEILNRFGEGTIEKIPVKEVSLPSFDFAQQLGRRENFSLFIPKHRKVAGRLVEILMGMRNYEDFLSASVFCHDRVNPYLYIYCLSVAILHRPDTQNLPLPSHCEVFPDKYVDSGIFAKAREEANVVPAGSRIPIEIPRDYTASDLDEEHKVAYFREDLGVNLHHWHWHLVYPFTGPRQIVQKDRRGELLYYMHQQIQARYNFERFCNGLGRVKRWNNWRDPIPEAYFPKLDSLVASRSWPARPANAVLKDVNRPADQIQVDIQDMERWRDRIYEVIQTGAILNDKGERVPLTETGGIDLLGDIMEASILSPNPNLYGDLHNFMHVTLSYVHDPDHRYLESFSPIGDPSTTMRDPVFYRLHQYVEDVFQQHKRTLQPYTQQQLGYPDVRVTDAEIVTPNASKNVLSTFWQQSDVDMSRGLDFVPRGSVLARYTHLQHVPYVYRIKVVNQSRTLKLGTCRIYMSPKTDERGLPMPFRDQKNFMIELDKFTVSLKPGENQVERKSDESSVTIPFERTFRNLDAGRPTDVAQLEEFNFCGCGWPQHMLIPKGTKEGLRSELFVMISNYDNDKVEQNVEGRCVNAMSYCGIRNKKYPDARPMGFPFDRWPREGVETLNQFLTPNMIVKDVTIRHRDEVLKRPVDNAV